MSKKRGAESAGIKIHVKRDEFEYEEQLREQQRGGAGNSSGEEDEEEQQQQRKQTVSTTKTKKIARRSLTSTQQPQQSSFAPTAPAASISDVPVPANPFSAVTFLGSAAPPPKAEAPAAAAPVAPAAVAPSGTGKDASYYKQVAALNQNFIQWFERKMKQDESMPLTAGVGKYIEYCKQFEKGGSLVPATTTAPLFSSPAPSTATATNGKSIFSPESAVKPAPLFGGAAAAVATSAVTIGRAGEDVAIPLFGASAPVAAAAVPTTSLFGGAPAVTVTAPAPAAAAAPTTSSLFGTAPAAAPTTSLFGSATSAPTSSLFGNTAAAPASSLFGNAPAAAPTTSLFGSATSTAPTSSLFGSAASTAPTSSLFGNAGFPSTLFAAPAAASSTAAVGGGDEDEGEDDAPLQEDEPVVEVLKSSNEAEEVLFEAEGTKAFLLVGREFVTKGEGRIAFSRDRADKSKCKLVIRSPTTGKIFFNAPINVSMKSSITQKKRSVLLSTLSFSLNVETNELEPENGGKPGLYRMLLPTEDEAKRFHDALLAAL